MKRLGRLGWIFLILCFRSVAEVSPGTGLQISAAGDIVGNFGGTYSNRLLPREAEVLLYAPIDHLFDGTLNTAAHYESGQVFFEIHELWIGSTKLIPRSRFRLGQFFLSVGRLNQFHRHDWPFTSAPKVQSEFFDTEGLNDAGLEYSYLLPTPFYLDLTVGITNGWIYGHSHNEGFKPVVPTHYARLVTYNSLFLGGGMQTGFNYMARTSNQGKRMTLLGLDLTAKWKAANFLRFLFQNEFWYRILSNPGLPDESAFGFYVFPQYGFTETLFLGFRVDGLMVKGSSDYDYGFVPSLSYKASEFSTVRLSYNLKGRLSAGLDDLARKEQGVELQAIFILGSHPAHDF